jgi:predicted ATP-dependent endonuclease of OLD family
MLESLLIKNFRSLEHLEVSKLGRINLIVGKNNCGKSTVLEALRIYAGNAQRPLLEMIAREHDERYRIREAELFEEQQNMPFQDFFSGREFPATDEKTILIGPLNDEQNILSVQHALMEEISELEEIEDGQSINRIRRRIILKAEAPTSQADLQQVILIRKGDRIFPPMKLMNTRSRFMTMEPGSFACSTIPTQFVSMDELADAWDSIVFTDQEEIVKIALQVIVPEFENLTFIRSDQESTSSSRGRASRTAMVKLAGLDRPVPLNSMGDGMLRVLQLALKLFAAKGGFLLIDEFENGLHYSVQERIWGLLFGMAEKYDIQIFATTHSWDCIESFTKVAVDRTQTDGVLFRMGRSVRASDKGRVIATVFDEEALANITQADMEVR